MEEHEISQHIQQNPNQILEMQIAEKTEIKDYTRSSKSIFIIGMNSNTPWVNNN